jgi:hypothetical protein
LLRVRQQQPFLPRFEGLRYLESGLSAIKVFLCCLHLVGLWILALLERVKLLKRSIEGNTLALESLVRLLSSREFLIDINTCPAPLQRNVTCLQEALEIFQHGGAQ